MSEYCKENDLDTFARRKGVNKCGGKLEIGFFIAVGDSAFLHQLIGAHDLLRRQKDATLEPWLGIRQCGEVLPS